MAKRCLALCLVVTDRSYGSLQCWSEYLQAAASLQTLRAEKATEKQTKPYTNPELCTCRWSYTEHEKASAVTDARKTGPSGLETAHGHREIWYKVEKEQMLFSGPQKLGGIKGLPHVSENIRVEGSEQ